MKVIITAKSCSQGEGSPTKLLNHSSQSGSRFEDSSSENMPVHYVKPYYCGVGPCHPKKLQWFATTKFFTFMLCINALIEGALVSGKQNWVNHASQ